MNSIEDSDRNRFQKLVMISHLGYELSKTISTMCEETSLKIIKNYLVEPDLSIAEQSDLLFIRRNLHMFVNKITGEK